MFGGHLRAGRVVEADVGAGVRHQAAHAGGEAAGRTLRDPGDQLAGDLHVPVDDHERHTELRREAHRVAVADGGDGDDAVHPLVQEDLERLPLPGAVDVGHGEEDLVPALARPQLDAVDDFTRVGVARGGDQHAEQLGRTAPEGAGGSVGAVVERSRRVRDTLPSGWADGGVAGQGPARGGSGDGGAGGDVPQVTAERRPAVRPAMVRRPSGRSRRSTPTGRDPRSTCARHGRRDRSHSPLSTRW